MFKVPYICDAVRTPFGRFGGALSSIRADDLGALPLTALMARNASVDWAAVDDVIYGCANQAGEDNRNVARMSLLLAGLPQSVSGTTVNRLCGSGMDAIILASQAVGSGQSDFLIAGGVENMSRAPFVVPKADKAFSRNNSIEDTTIGWRFINPKMRELYGCDSMPETAENVASEFQISREDQDAFALRSQKRYAIAEASGFFSSERMSVSIPKRKSDPIQFNADEHPRPNSNEAQLQKLKPVVTLEGSVTAGNASGVNDGAGALIIADENTAKNQNLNPIARVVASATAGVAPRTMGIGPVPAVEKLLRKAGLTVEDIDVFELNEAFAAQALACSRGLGLTDDAKHVNPNGGAIAIGHPLGASGARLVMTAAYQLKATSGRYAVCTMCVGVGQGIAILIERV